jgi:hypothetical protein
MLRRVVFFWLSCVALFAFSGCLDQQTSSSLEQVTEGTISQPAMDALYKTGDAVVFVVQVTRESSELGSLIWTSDLDGELATSEFDVNNEEESANGPADIEQTIEGLSPGRHLISLWWKGARNSSGDGEEAAEGAEGSEGVSEPRELTSVTILVNTPPSKLVVTFDPVAPKTLDDFEAVLGDTGEEQEAHDEP